MSTSPVVEQRDILPIKFLGCKELFSEILNNTDVFCFDCDGVLWQGGKTITNAPEVVNFLKREGKEVIYITNNSTKTRSEYAQKLCQLGYSADINDVFCTAYISAAVIKDALKENEQVYVVGNEAMGKELDNVGVKHFGIGKDVEITSQLFDTSKPLHPNVGAVLVGMDGNFHFSKITKAASYLGNEKCIFVATNEDPQLPIGGSDYVVPGTGSLDKCVEVASERRPNIICGKPHKCLEQFLHDRRDLSKKNIMMVGDRLNTDIMFGNISGFSTLAVLTGCTDTNLLQRVVQNKDSEKLLMPTYYIDSIADLLQLF